MTQQSWHQLPADEVLAAQQTSHTGLSADEAARAAGVAEHIRKALEARRFSFNGEVTRVTASFGVAEFPAEAAIASQLVRSADERLYRTKDGGRNRGGYE